MEHHNAQTDDVWIYFDWRMFCVRSLIYVYWDDAIITAFRDKKLRTTHSN